VSRYPSFLNVKSAAGAAGLALFGILEWLFGHTIYAACLAFFEVHWQMSDGQLTAVLAQYAIPLAASGLLAWFIFWAGLRHGRQAAGPDIAAVAPSTKAGAPLSPATLSIEFGQNKNYVREEHLTNGMLRKSIYVSIYNNGDATAYDCNIKLMASTPVLTTGAALTKYPVFFGANFNLVAKERAFVKVLSFAESGAINALERDNILISAAAGPGWFGGWTTLSPLPTKDNPSLLTLEAFALV
jgi:hypothetical protein